MGAPGAETKVGLLEGLGEASVEAPLRPGSPPGKPQINACDTIQGVGQNSNENKESTNSSWEVSIQGKG